MALIADAIEGSLRTLTDGMLDALVGIPDDVFTTWKPAAAREGSHEMNTFAALATHALGAAENWTLIITGARPATRDRAAEFRARTTLAEIRARRDAWLTELHTQLAGMTEADFAASIPAALAQGNASDWTILRGMVHAVDHTALHLGHIQIQRQLWEYERDES
jgi:hypothetical protein